MVTTTAAAGDEIMPKYVPPYDTKEKHLPGMNYCGPGTNVAKRLANNVQPMDPLDKACLEHDLSLIHI